jgi:hypothetical protein
MNGQDLLSDYVAIIATAAAIGMAVTNLVKMGGEIPSWCKPLVAYLAAFIGLTCFLYFRDGFMDLRIVAGNLVFAAMATGGAMLLHELDGTSRVAESKREADKFLGAVPPIERVR